VTGAAHDPSGSLLISETYREMQRKLHTGAAIKFLPDGRNAHLIQRPVSWWLPKFMERFELTAYNRMPSGFWVAVECAHASGNSPGNASAN
jgi:hypothetical protein